MAIKSYFFNAVESGGVYDRVYNAEDVTSYLNGVVSDGVLPNLTQLQVKTLNWMTIVVSAGSGWIQGHKMVNDGNKLITIDSSDDTLNRIDSIIFYLDYTTRTMGIEVLKGAYALDPVPAALTRTSSRWEMCLAQIRINKNTTAILNSMITDTRGDADLCGFARCLINSPTKLIKLEGVYSTQTSGETTFDVTDYIPDYDPSVDVLEVYLNGAHQTKNQYTLSGTVVTMTTPVSAAGITIDFVVYRLS